MDGEGRDFERVKIKKSSKFATIEYTIYTYICIVYRNFRTFSKLLTMILQLVVRKRQESLIVKEKNLFSTVEYSFNLTACVATTSPIFIYLFFIKKYNILAKI